ncbi:MAG: hypothetical protein M1429_02435 [Patescibacteria group bacterium]|nr:hypothetical protein [Patescibacteria group bacterium]
MRVVCRAIWRVFDSTWFVIFCILLILVSRSASAKWYSGIIHVHSTFSDGDRTPGMVIRNAEKAGFQFLIETDHYEQIEKPQTLRSRLVKDYGFNNYWQKFSSNNLIIVRGAEIETRRGNARVHTLVLGDLKYDQGLMDLQGKEGNQQAVIDYLNQKGFLSVAAHPSLITAIGTQTWRGECSDFSYNKSQCKGLSGIEFFNEDEAGYQQTLKWYLGLIAKGESPFVTAGCDSHSPLLEPVNDTKRWQRRTMVYSDRVLTPEILFEDITYGQTYAANNGAYFKDINYIIGKCYWRVDRPKFKLSIGFSKKTTSSKVLRIYRDGQLAEGSVKSLPVGLKEYSYTCEDKVVKPGKHRYVIEVEGCLITSPIGLEVTGSKPAPAKVIVRSIPNKTINSSLYRDAIDEPIKENLARLWQTKEKSTHLVIAKEDQDYIRNYDADRRVLMALLELAKTHTLAIRMKIGYQNERCWISRETAPSGGMPNISAHFTAQAYDIFCADGVEIAWQVSADSAKKAKAHQKIQQLIREIIAIGRKDSNLLPTQMMIYSWDDVNVFTAELNRYYGPVSQRGNSGMWANDRMWDRIHIGY